MDTKRLYELATKPSLELTFEEKQLGYWKDAEGRLFIGDFLEVIVPFIPDEYEDEDK